MLVVDKYDCLFMQDFYFTNVYVSIVMAPHYFLFSYLCLLYVLYIYGQVTACPWITSASWTALFIGRLQVKFKLLVMLLFTKIRALLFEGAPISHSSCPTIMPENIDILQVTSIKQWWNPKKWAFSFMALLENHPTWDSHSRYFGPIKWVLNIWRYPLAIR